jgi:AraC-like DNA-binding protein
MRKPCAPEADRRASHGRIGFALPELRGCRIAAPVTMSDSLTTITRIESRPERVRTYVRLIVTALRTVSRLVAPAGPAAAAPDVLPRTDTRGEISLGVMRACVDAVEEQIASATHVLESREPAAAHERRSAIDVDELAACLERHILTRGSRAELPAPSPVDEIRRYVEAHFAEPLTLARVAAALGCARSQVAAAFTHHLGETMHRYLARVRIRRAVEQIVEGDKIESVMLAVGYRSKKNFYRQFRREIGDTPAVYRERVARVEPNRPAAARDVAGIHVARPDLVTVAGASEFLGVSRRTVHNWIRKGKLKTALQPDGGRRIVLGARRSG